MSSDPLSEYEAARETLAERQAAVEEIGAQQLQQLADALDDATLLLDRYEESATGTGDFGSYIEFQSQVVELVEPLPEDLPRRDCFERYSDVLHRRALRSKEFDAARDALEGARPLRARLQKRNDAEKRVQQARRELLERRDTLETEVETLESLRAYQGIDFDAPVEQVREPIETYNEATRAAFDAFTHDAPVRELFALLETTEQYPLVPFRSPPERLTAYLETAPPGTESLHGLLELASFSASKLSHYVEDTTAFQTAVAANRTYLEALDASPLTIDWPPPSGGVLRFRARELRAVLDRFPTPDVASQARTLRALARTEEYARLSEVARAREELDEADRSRLRDGTVESELEAKRQELDRVREALRA